MNRVVTRNLEGLRPGALPPRRRSDGPVRVLFLTLDAMGWSAWARAIAAATAQRDDIDAVHVRYWGGGPKRLLSAPVSRGHGWLDSEARRMAVARVLVRRWLRGPLDVSAFDVVHVAPQKYALGVIDAIGDQTLSVLLDATVWQEKGELGGLDRPAVRRAYSPLLAAEEAVARRVDLVAAMSRWAATSVTADFAVPDDRIVVTPPFARRIQPRQRPGEARPLRLVFVGHDWERKGGPRLLSWHQERWADSVELHICSAGARYQAGARNTFWHGRVPNEVLVRDLLPEMDLLVLPTSLDMSPWALVEGAAAGLPIVSSAVGGIPELVLEGETGCLLPPDDDDGFVKAIDRLLEDHARRERMGHAAQERARARFDADVVLDGFLDRLVAAGARR